MRSALSLGALALALSCAGPAFAGPPFLTDDPEPTPQHEYEVLFFAEGEPLRGDVGGSTGIDFNYGAGPDLQLTAALPIAFEDTGAGRDWGVGNVELAAKLRILHQDSFGWDVAIFPRVYLPSGSDIGDQHASFLLPIWIGREGEGWSTFGGGGCAINRGGASQDYCVAGWAATFDVAPNLNLGAELFHQTADVEGGEATTTFGVGGTYDLNQTLHLLGWLGADTGNFGEAEHTAWYTSLLFTF